MADLQEILEQFNPFTLTEAVNLIKVDEPLVLTSRLGKNIYRAYDEVCVFEVEEGSYSLAPMGYPNDPASEINISRKRKHYAVTPPQIFLKDRITASEINQVRLAAQNPINMTVQDKASAFDSRIAIKQLGLKRMIERRTEWLFAQAMNGKIEYKNLDGREFSHDYNFPNSTIGNIASADYWDKAGNPLHQLRALAKTFKALNNQLAPDLIIMGSKAGDAFMNNEHIEAWLKSPGVQLFQSQNPLARGEAQPLGILEGAEVFEYSSTYDDDSGKPKTYIKDNYVYLTNSTLWRLFYGAINDFSAGNPPIVARELFSKMVYSPDGKALDIYVESHPLPVIVSNLGVVKAQVC